MPLPKRIVLVDDNPFDNEFHTIILRKAGFVGEIVMCEEGNEAVPVIESACRDGTCLVFLDINLPGWSGFDVANALQSRQALQSRIFLVMLSSSPDPRDITKARSVGVIRDFLTKPLTAEGICTVLSRCASDAPPSSDRATVH